MTMGERIRQAREREGMSQRQLAQEAQVHHSAISRVEDGSRLWMGIPATKRVARVLKVSVDYLVGMYNDVA